MSSWGVASVLGLACGRQARRRPRHIGAGRRRGPVAMTESFPGTQAQAPRGPWARGPLDGIWFPTASAATPAAAGHKHGRRSEAPNVVSGRSVKERSVPPLFGAGARGPHDAQPRTRHRQGEGEYEGDRPDLAAAGSMAAGDRQSAAAVLRRAHGPRKHSPEPRRVGGCDGATDTAPQGQVDGAGRTEPQRVNGRGTGKAAHRAAGPDAQRAEAR